MATEDDVLKIAELARLFVTDQEKPALTSNFNAILGYIEKLKVVNVDQVEPMSHVHGVSNVFREDLAKHWGDPELILKNAPQRSGRFVKTPIIVE